MRYPLWAFFFVLVLPPFAAHALLAGKARMVTPPLQVTETRQVPVDDQPASHWRHSVTRR
jgi:hypothetical protein